MTHSITITLDQDEAEILIDALETDLESYLDSAKAERDRDTAATFKEAAGRIKAVRDKLQAKLGA